MELRNRGYLQEEESLINISKIRQIVVRAAKSSLMKKVMQDFGLDKSAVAEFSDNVLPYYLATILCALLSKKGKKLGSGVKMMCLDNAKEILMAIKNSGMGKEEE
jgi:hypothetical protein